MSFFRRGYGYMAGAGGLGSLLAMLFIKEAPDSSQIFALGLIALGALQPWTWWRSQVQSEMAQA